MGLLTHNLSSLITSAVKKKKKPSEHKVRACKGNKFITSEIKKKKNIIKLRSLSVADIHKDFRPRNVFFDL